MNVHQWLQIVSARVKAVETIQEHTAVIALVLDRYLVVTEEHVKVCINLSMVIVHVSLTSHHNINIYIYETWIKSVPVYIEEFEEFKYPRQFEGDKFI